jgi:CO/xanthine dehydrogenase Mo-binding subunit
MIQEAWAGPVQPLFAHTQVTHVGQALGLILAKTQAAAEAGAKAVRVRYGPPDSSSSSGDKSSGGSGLPQQQAGEGGVAGQQSEPNGVSGVSSSSSSSVGDARQYPALTSLSAAAAADSWYDLGKFPGTSSASKGE